MQPHPFSTTFGRHRISAPPTYNTGGLSQLSRIQRRSRIFGSRNCTITRVRGRGHLAMDRGGPAVGPKGVTRADWGEADTRDLLSLDPRPPVPLDCDADRGAVEQGVGLLHTPRGGRGQHDRGPHRSRVANTTAQINNRTRCITKSCAFRDVAGEGRFGLVYRAQIRMTSAQPFKPLGGRCAASH